MGVGEGKIILIAPTEPAVNDVENIIEKKTGRSFHSGFSNYEDLDDLIKSDVYIRDSSKTNKASIALVLSYENRKFAFLGDAHCEDLVDGFKNYFNDCYVDLVKLSHHGSQYNINKELIKVMGTNTFLISTDKPINKRTLARIANACEVSNIYCNYNWWEKDDLAKKYYFTQNDQQKYLNNGKISLVDLGNRDVKVLDKEGIEVCILKTR